ncbi:hypothetical protein NK004_20465, partial [Klebsiella quasipneumoniae]|nr:hypothetical protein [Klebsiella quasipneumoniae]
GPDPVCESPPDMGPLKLPVLAASKSLRRSRKAGAVCRPGKRSAAGRWHQARSRFYAGWRLSPYPAYGVQIQYVNRRRTWGR